jgi:hypothetical protein
MFVQIIKRKNKNSISLAVKIVESYRQEEKVKKKVLLYLGSIDFENVGIQALREKFVTKASRLINQYVGREDLASKLLEDLNKKLINSTCRSSITDINCSSFRGIS